MLKSQKELKAEYTEQLKKAWDSPAMVKFCANEAGYIIEYNNKLYSIEKPAIHTRFCFGYGFCGVSDEEEEAAANAMARKAESDVDYFKAENLRGIDETIKQLEEIADEMGHNWAEGSHPRYMIKTGAHYSGQTPDCKLEYFKIEDTFSALYRGGVLCYDVEFVRALIAGYQEVKKAFEKRLNTYLKRYGLSKVESWSYLSD